MGKIKVIMDKPIYLGQAILDLSKTYMYEFHNDYMVPKYGENFCLRGAPSIEAQGPPCLTLCYMDSDSPVY